jgi:single stranded DNA-binding protein
MAVKNRKKETIWVGIACWGQNAEFVRQYAKKGDTVFVEGSLEFKPYTDKDGNPGVYIDVSATTVVLMGGSRDSGDGSGENKPVNPSRDGRVLTTRDDWGSQQKTQPSGGSGDPIPF